MPMAVCLKHNYQLQHAEVMAEFRLVVLADKTLPRTFESVLPFISQCVDAAWAGYMKENCTCVDDSSTIKPPSTVRMGASWGTGDVANLADFDDQ